MAIQPPEYEEFQMTEIQLTEYNSGGFTLLINDHRPNREYITTIYVNDEEYRQLTFKNGTNKLSVNLFSYEYDYKVKIEIYDPENEFNGYGSKPNPWILTYTSE